MDRLSFDLVNGYRTISNYTITDDAGTPATVTPSSGVLEDLFDLRQDIAQGDQTKTLID